MRRSYGYLFLVAAALRFFCVPVFVIDDDEAWSSAASLAMKSPWHFYRSAVDHKPPGFVWFYWFVDHLVPLASDPRVVRAVFTLLAILAALVVGYMANRFAHARGGAEGAARKAAGKVGNVGNVGNVEWCAATLFLLVTALPAPKLLAVTADGLIADLVIFAYAVALFSELTFAAFLSGALLALALLVKQTAVFFAIPILFARWPRNWSWKEIPLFALGAACVLVPCIIGLGVSDFFYWNWTYPKEVLVAVRAQLFESNFQGLKTLALYLLAILPVAWALIRAFTRTFSREGLRGMSAGLRDFRVLWLLAGLCGFAIGRGLFLHYLLLIAAPVVLLGAEVLVTGRSSWKTFSWLGVQYVAGCLILAIPASGIFWGTDLVYFQAVGRVMKASLRPGEKAMVWGGSALPLAYARIPHVTRFVLPRFAVPPYATESTRDIFHRELKDDLPELILDLHERGDNQFDNPIASEPFVANLIHSRYKLYVSESIPWAKFYFLSPPVPAAGLLPVADEQRAQALYEPFPRRRESWERLGEVAKKQGFKRAIEIDWVFRAEASLALVGRQASDLGSRAHAATFARCLEGDATVSPDLRSQILRFMTSQASASDGVLPIPMLSPSWWGTVAMVELQPRASIPPPSERVP